MGWNLRGKRWIICLLGLGMLLSGTRIAQAEVDLEPLASTIAASIQKLPGDQYHTIAIYRIKKRNNNLPININELIDYTNVKIVRSRRFQVTDRSKLQLLLKEQSIQLSDFVSPNQYRELGQLLGVQLFVYGTIYNDALVLKAIDVQTSAIVWAEAFQLKEESPEHDLFRELSSKLLDSMSEDFERFKTEKVQRLSFWNIDTPTTFASEQVMDYLTVTLSKQPDLSVIDRENLQLIYQEQKLNQSAFIDESQARKLGEIYGVDAFLYGTVTHKPDESYLASLKMMSVFSGVILWADLLKFDRPQRQPKTFQLVNPFEKKLKQRLNRQNLFREMVTIPEGTFVMGSNDPLYNAAPERIVHLKAFLIDRQEVNQRQYQEFVEKTSHRVPTIWKQNGPEASQLDWPIVGISWEDAKLYCQFVEKRLPSEAEWERAARGREGRKYPWRGPSVAPNFAILRDGDYRNAVSIATQNADITEEGVMHLAGNVREFVADLYRPYPGQTKAENYPQGERVIRGSSWAFTAYEAAGFFRGHTRPNLAWPDTGLRCAKDL